MKIKTVYIEITNRCNLNCKTCYNRSGLNKTTKEISIEQIKNVISLFSKYGAYRFLFSGGEPTLHSKFYELTELIKKYPNYSFGIVTNGTTNNTHLANLINSSNNCTLQISLDGSSEDENKLTRGAGNFAKAISFAKMIKGNNKNLLKMVISKANYKSVEAFYELALSLNFIPEFAFIYKSGNAIDNWDTNCLTAQEKVQILTLIDKLNSKYSINAFLPKCTMNCTFLSDDNELSICIKTDGSIQPCQSLYDSQYTLSNAFDFNENHFVQNLHKIQNIAKSRLCIDYDCNKCIVNKICGRGCMAEAYNLNADPLKNDGNCEYRKLQFINYDLKRVHNS